MNRCRCGWAWSGNCSRCDRGVYDPDDGDGIAETMVHAWSGPAPRPRACGKYIGDNDGTCPQLTCVRPAGHEGLCDNVRGDAPGGGGS